MNGSREELKNKKSHISAALFLIGISTLNMHATRYFNALRIHPLRIIAA